MTVIELIKVLKLEGEIKMKPNLTSSLKTYFVLILMALSLIACQSTKDHRTENTSSAVSLTGGIDRAEVPQTGQKISYATGDDGNLRSGKPWPNPRFTDNGDGTVTDQLTGLMWTKNADQANGTLDWEDALSKSITCAVGGFKDWRLPNQKELQSLVDLGNVQPALPPGHPFENVKSSYYWSSTTAAKSEDHAWILHFYAGLATSDDKGGTHYVCYVRGGHSKYSRSIQKGRRSN
jgi:hypothetical protein